MALPDPARDGEASAPIASTRFANRVVIVTGAGTGIGAATAIRFALAEMAGAFCFFLSKVHISFAFKI
jgi:hypothetical protein